MKKHDILAIIVASGQGRRMGSDLPKQFLPLAGTPLVMRSMQALAAALEGHSARFVLVLAGDRQAYWQELCLAHNFDLPHTVVTGGAQRFDSVRAALSVSSPVPGELILVHDGVRPFVRRSTVAELLECAAEGGTAVPVRPLTESLRHGGRAVDRSEYVAVQTPQVFGGELIRAAYALPYSSRFTDDASVAEAAGIEIFPVTTNDYRNIKVTTPDDLLVAEALLSHPE